MGTRGAYGFRVNEKDKLAYNHSDSYPGWLGRDVLRFVSGSSCEELRQIAENVEMVEESGKPTSEQILECQPWTDVDEDDSSVGTWYDLLRGLQGDLEPYKEGLRYLPTCGKFILDPILCEYAYVINVDSGKLEFYCSKRELGGKYGEGRYAGKRLQGEKGYGSVLVKEYELKELSGISEEKIEALTKEMDAEAKALQSDLGRIGRRRNSMP